MTDYQPEASADRLRWEQGLGPNEVGRAFEAGADEIARLRTKVRELELEREELLCMIDDMSHNTEDDDD